MSDRMNFEIEKTCAFTGHREVGDDLDLPLLETCVEEFIADGYNCFLCGMARGFDLIAADLILKLKEKHCDIKLIACVPCPNQSKFYHQEEKTKYDRILSVCDDVLTVSSHYFNGCMQVRDRYMVDNSSLIIAYSRNKTGGTYYTVNYASSHNKKICII